jgi:hypothetical protein
MDWKKLITQNVGQEQLPDISTYVEMETIIKKSPIDVFYGESRGILLGTPTTIDRTNWEGCAYVVALVSITENYFRSVLSEILNICQVTKKNAAENSINFGSVLWHPGEFITRGAFEHISFSDSKKIIEVTKKYVGHDIGRTDLIPILDEFTKVCELRHGIVHSGRYMAGKNALILDVPSSSDLIKICIGYGQLQSIASVCTTLVISYNKIMFELLCKRWATVWRTNSSWDSSLEDEYLKSIWFIFFSKVDKNDGTIAERGTWIKCRNLIKREFNLV